MDVFRLQGSIGADIAPLQSALGQADSLVKGHVGQMNNLLKQGLSFAAGFAGFDAVTSIFGNLKSAIIDTNSQLEQATLTFARFTGGTEQAKVFLGDLQKMAVTTPFEFPDLVRGAERLMNFGVQAKDVIPLLTNIGDVAGGSSERIQRMSLAFGQMLTIGKIQGDELNQLAEAGVSVSEVLDIMGKNMGKSRDEMQKLQQAGKLSSKEFIAAFQEWASVKWGGAMAQQANTFTGALSTVRDALTQLIARGFKPFFELASSGMQGLANILQTEQFVGFANTLATAMEGLVGWFTKLVPTILPVLIAVGGFAATLLGAAAAVGILTPIIGVLGTLIGTITAPLGLVAVGVGLLGAAFAANFLGIRDIVTSVVGHVVGIVQGLIDLLFGGYGDKTALLKAIEGLFPAPVATAIAYGIDLIQELLGIITGGSPEAMRSFDVLRTAIEKLFGPDAVEPIMGFAGRFSFALGNIKDAAAGLFQALGGGNFAPLEKALEALNIPPEVVTAILQLVGALAKLPDTLGGIIGSGIQNEIAGWQRVFETIGPILVNDVLPAMQKLGRIELAATGQALVALNNAVQGFPGAMSAAGEAIGGVATWLQTLNTLLTPVTQALQTAVEGALGGIGKTLGPIFSQIGASMSQLGTAAAGFGATMGVLGPYMDMVKQAGIGLAAVLGGIMVGAFGLLLGVVGGVIGSLAGALPGAIQVLTGAFQIVAGVIEVVAGAIVGAVGFVVHAIQGDWPAAAQSLIDGSVVIREGLTTIWNGIVNMVVGLVKTMTGGVEGMVSGFVNTVVGFFQGLANSLVGGSIVPDMVNGIIAAFARLPGEVGAVVAGWVSEVVSAVAGMVSNVVSAVGGMASDVLGRFGEMVSSAVAQAGEMAAQTIAKAQELASGTLAAIVEGGINVVSEVGTWPGRIVSALGNIASKLREIGVSAGQGLVEGLRSMISSVAAAAADLANAALDQLHTIFQNPPAPSRVTANMGASAGQGLATGLRGSAAAVRQATAELGDTVIDQLSLDLQKIIHPSFGQHTATVFGQVITGSGFQFYKDLRDLAARTFAATGQMLPESVWPEAAKALAEWGLSAVTSKHPELEAATKGPTGTWTNLREAAEKAGAAAGEAGGAALAAAMSKAAISGFADPVIRRDMTLAITANANRAMAEAAVDVQAIVAHPGSAGGGWHVLGSAAIDGVASGMAAAAANAAATASDVMSQVVAAAASAVGAHSPAEATKPIGASLMEGIASGIESAVVPLSRRFATALQTAIARGGANTIGGNAAGDVTAWSANVGVAPWVGQMYTQAYGSLPQTLDQLNKFLAAIGAVAYGQYAPGSEPTQAIFAELQKVIAEAHDPTKRLSEMFTAIAGAAKDAAAPLSGAVSLFRDLIEAQMANASVALPNVGAISGAADAAKAMLSTVRRLGAADALPAVTDAYRQLQAATRDLGPKMDLVQQVGALVAGFEQLGIAMPDSLATAIAKVGTSLGGPFADAITRLLTPAADTPAQTALKQLQGFLDEFDLMNRLSAALAATTAAGVQLPSSLMDVLAKVPRASGGLLDDFIKRIGSGDFGAAFAPPAANVVIVQATVANDIDIEAMARRVAQVVYGSA